MKRNLKRIGIIIFILFVILQNYCFADVVVYKTFWSSVPIIIGLIATIGVVILIVSIISVVYLKRISNKDSKLSEIIKGDEKNKRLERAKKRIYRWSIFLTIIWSIYMCIKIPASGIRIFSAGSVILFVVSIIIRLNKKYRISNIIWKVAIAIIIIISVIFLWDNTYNSKFTKYIHEFSNLQCMMSSEINDFISDVVDNNKKNYKIKIVYNKTNIYETEEELNSLLEELTEIVNTVYEKYYAVDGVKYEDFSFITNIHIYEYYSFWGRINEIKISHSGDE